MIASAACGTMPSGLSTRPSASASADTTLSDASKSTWSRVVVNKFGKKAECRLRRELCRGRDPTRWTKRQADEQTAAIDRAQGEFRRFAQGHRPRTAEFVRHAGLRHTRERGGDCLRDVADIDWLQAGFAAAQQGQSRKIASERAEAVEEIILRAETRLTDEE